MGDSEGEQIDFERCGADIRAAVDQLFSLVPGLEEVYLWGLCDGASAACLYAPGDTRVRGLVLLNPWVRTETGVARARLKHYYLDRLRDPEFWTKVARGRWHWRKTLREAAGFVRAGLRPRGGQRSPDPGGTGATPEAPLPDRMAASLESFAGGILVVLSGNDLVGDEFRDLVSASARWRRLMLQGGVERRELPEANHTFSRRIWRDQVTAWTAEWMLR
jgi:exosortase A-associated hydrolase 1